MKVYLGIKTYYNYCESFDFVEKVFDDEIKAIIWVDEFKATETEWRGYEEREVE